MSAIALRAPVRRRGRLVPSASTRSLPTACTCQIRQVVSTGQHAFLMRQVVRSPLAGAHSDACLVGSAQRCRRYCAPNVLTNQTRRACCYDLGVISAIHFYGMRNLMRTYGPVGECPCNLGGLSRRLFTAVAAERLHRFERLGEITVGAEARARACAM